MWQIGTLPKHYNKHYLFLKFSVQSFTCEMKVKMLSPTDRHTYLPAGKSIIETTYLLEKVYVYPDV